MSWIIPVFYALSDESGTAIIQAIPAGKYEVVVKRIGYKQIRRKVIITEEKTTTLKLLLEKDSVKMDGLIVDATRTERKIVQPVMEISSQKLDQALSATIGETLSEEPGMDYISMGPAPSRPVMRGLGGSRLSILEDGDQTGDISSTSSDHAVAIEPITASKIEVIRGPEALVYGSNNIGGVINIERGYIPDHKIEKLSGVLSTQGETVNRGFVNSIELSFPISLFTGKVDGSYRKTNDIESPNNTLKNSDIENLNGSAGISLIRDWGMVGTAISDYSSDYGIPGGFKGGHPNGVRIEMQRFHSESKCLFDFDNSVIDYWEISHNYAHYYHEELERSDLIGVSFDLYSHKVKSNLITNPWLIFSKSIIGLWGEYKDYRIGGLSFAPDIVKNTLALYNYNELALSRWLVKTSIRFDYHDINPEDNEEGTHNPLVGYIRRRIFKGLSYSVSSNYYIGKGFFVDAIFMKTFRSPQMEELFSQGPHLAAYSYEIGNADMSEETGWGYEVDLSFKQDNLKMEVAVYANVFDNYIFQRNTGETEWSLLLPVYKNEGNDALIKGIEASFKWDLENKLTIAGNLTYVEGDLTETDTPLPYIPPLKAKLDLSYKIKNIIVGSRFNFVAEQDRLGEFEEATEGFFTQDIYARFLISKKIFQHSIDFSCENIYNNEYRRHLSKIKSIMPEPGRNFKLLYKLYF